jgi:hypothetical protein
MVELPGGAKMEIKDAQQATLAAAFFNDGVNTLTGIGVTNEQPVFLAQNSIQKCNANSEFVTTCVTELPA